MNVLLCLCLCCSVFANLKPKINLNAAKSLMAGVAVEDGTLLGAPLAGYDYAPRSVSTWPIPQLRNFTSFMNPSVGVINPTWIKAVVLDTGLEEICMITIDAIGSDGWLEQIAWMHATTLGFTIPFDKCTFSAAHTHSGPGAIATAFLFSIAPATDLLIPSLQKKFAHAMGRAMFNAQSRKVSAKIGVGIGELLGVTHNRRASVNGHKNPYVNDSTIDPTLGVIKIDDMNDTPLATIWNFAIHGVCFDSDNMLFSSDVMGSASYAIESMSGAPALFINGDAGDTNPNFTVACQNPPTPKNPYTWSGGPIIAKKVMSIRNSIITDAVVDMAMSSVDVPFGLAHPNLTLARVADCASGGPLGVCTLCAFLDCDLDPRLNSGWIDDSPRFAAIRLTLGGRTTLIVTLPGEGLVELGWAVRNATLLAGGYNQTLIAGYTNSYLGYFAPPNEYELGGYESVMTLFGINTTTKVLNGVMAAVSALP